jgi:SpoVK/Ycf46/Vps4 family AAA+-type ATPase
MCCAGTGKTALARAAAGSSGASFLIINGPDIVSEHLGDSEACLRGVFAAAERLAPSIVFIDEIDAITPSRDSSSYSAVSGRLVTALLNELDSLAGKKVVVLGATNRRTAIDDSLRRPGRFDRELEIGVPSPKDRVLILTKILDRMLHNLTVPQVWTACLYNH